MPETETATGGGLTVRRLATRGVSLLGVLLVLFILGYPARFFLGLVEMPLSIRLAWPLVALVASAAPRASLLAFLAGAPLLPIIAVREGWRLDSLAEMWLFALLAAAWGRIAVRGDARGALPGSALLLLAVGATSLVAVIYPFHLATDGFGPLARTLHEYAASELFAPVAPGHPYAPLQAWLLVAEGLALLWLMSAIFGADSPRRLIEPAIAMAAGGALVALYGIRQWWTKEDLLPFWVAQDPNIVRINATFTDVNALGAYLALIVWLLLAVAHARPSPDWRWLWRIGAATVAAALVFTASRAAWVSALFGCVLYVAGLGWFGLLREGSWADRNFRRLMTTGVLITVVVIGGLTAYATARDVRHADQRSYVQTVLYSVNLRTPLNERLKGRLPLWESAWRMIEARPVFGIGIGRYYNLLGAYASRPDTLVAPRENAHNYFLQTAAEQGLAGVACLIALVTAALVAAWRGAGGAASAPLRDVKRLALAAGVGVAVFIVASVTGHPLLEREGQFGFWPIAALALLLGRTTRPAGAPRRAALVAILAAAVFATLPARAMRETRRVDLSRLPFGLHEQELDRHGQRFRWTTGSVVLHVPGDARALVLPVRSVAPFPQTVRVLLDGALADEMRLTDQAWRALRYVLPDRRDTPRYYRVELHVQPTWSPANDPRVLGVMLGDYEWQK